MISATEILGGSRACSPRNSEMIDAIWSILVYYFDHINLKNVSLFIIKYIDYSYTPGYTLALGYFSR